MISVRQSIGILGGTFSPIHIGHLRGAIDSRELLHLDEVMLVPAGLQPLKGAPVVSAPHRARMVELAVENVPGLRADLRELTREGQSYTIDTLSELRQELGLGVSLTFIMGTDSLLTLPYWHRWQELLEFANIAIMERPGVELPTEGSLADWLARYRVDHTELAYRPAGAVALLAQPAIAVSSTELRNMIAAGKNARYFLPDAVMEYISAHDLFNRLDMNIARNVS